jgi:ABC-type maltose transport system permease subunit
MKSTFIIGIIILANILWVWAIIDIARSKFKIRNKNVIWYLIVLFFPIFGSILYFYLREKLIIKKHKKLQQNQINR